MEPGKFFVRGTSRQRPKRFRRLAFAAYTNHPPGLEAGFGGGELL